MHGFKIWILSDQNGRKIKIAFLDDIIIFSKKHAEHLLHLKRVFEKLKTPGVKLKLSKCSFCQQQIKYLGHIISEDGFEPDPSKF